MNKYKVVIVGGGSYNWTPTLTTDLFLKKGLKHSELVLVDIDIEAANTLKKYCELVIDKIGANWKVTVDTLDNALKGADIVCVSISTGGLEAMHKDYHIPEKYGVLHTVGDTVGPAGISRTLRNVPVFVDIAKKMERLCPDAWMVHVTNPLSQLTRAVNLTTSIKCVGLCHNYSGTISMLAGYFGVKKEEIDAVSVGVNHFTWMKSLTCQGKPIEDQLSLKRYITYYQNKKGGAPLSHTTDDEIQKMLVGENMEYYFNFAIYEKYGVFPVGSSNHVAENLPFYCNSKEMLEKYHIRRKGVLPRRQMLMDQKKEKIQKIVEGLNPLTEIEASNEGFADVVESLCTGTSNSCIVAIANQGQITNIAQDVVVETWATVNGSGIHPHMSGEIPEPLVGYMQTIIDEQEITVKAALTGDLQMVKQAIAISPQLQNKDLAEELTEELLLANKEWLPQFYQE